MKSIRSRLLVNIIGGMVLLAALITLLSAIFSLKSTAQSTQKTLTETAKVAASYIAAELETYQAVVQETGALPSLSDPSLSPEEKMAIVDQKIKYYGFARGNIVDANGISPVDGLDLSEREYFKESMKGNSWISEPAVSKSTGEVVIMVSAPIWKGGVPNSEVVGVVYFTQTSKLITDLVREIKVGDSGTAYILNKAGTTIAHHDDTIVQNFENTQEMAASDPKLKPLADLEARMTNGETGFGEYSYGGIEKYLAFAPIDIPSKWSIAISAQKYEFVQYTYQSVIISSIASVVLLIFFIIANVIFANSLAGPIASVTKRLQQLSEGDLHTPVEVSKNQDESGRLSRSTDQTIHSLNAYIDAIGSILRNISEGNLAYTKPDVHFAGDFSQLEHSMDEITEKLSGAISTMQRNADQVFQGSDQVSSAAMALSQGATEQASAVEELMATMSDVSSHIAQTADHAKDARFESLAAEKQVEESNRKMQDMTQAMADISHKSGEIGKIIKTIDDIAFQTNILALNAAVEAARAGSAGKGFAVVADEVRNLAGKSATAAKSTTALIEETIRSVENGTKIAGETATALNSVVTGTQSVTRIIDDISSAASTQSESISQISLGISQISAVVQTNSATAEESAAASEQLSAQARVLKDLVGTFKLK